MNGEGVMSELSRENYSGNFINEIKHGNGLKPKYSSCESDEVSRTEYRGIWKDDHLVEKLE